MIQETKCSSNFLDRIEINCWHGCQAMAVDARGETWVIAILWDPKSVVLENFFSNPRTLTTRYSLIGTTTTFLQMYMGPSY